MEKVCAVVVFLAVYQLAGMLNYHKGPLLTSQHLDSVCHSAGNSVGLRLC